MEHKENEWTTTSHNTDESQKMSKRSQTHEYFCLVPFIESASATTDITSWKQPHSIREDSDNMVYRRAFEVLITFGCLTYEMIIQVYGDLHFVKIY
jgi:hypothetical protein